MALPSGKTKSFLFFFLVAIFVGNMALIFYREYILGDMDKTSSWADFFGQKLKQTELDNPAYSDVTAVTDSMQVAQWPTYVDDIYHFAFRYPKGWVVTSRYANNNEALPYIVEIKPTQNSSGFTITLTSDAFVGLGGAETVATLIDEKPGVTAKNLIYGVEYRGVYYSFDIGPQISKKQDFNSLVQSFRF